MQPVQIGCRLLLNDSDAHAVELLKAETAPILADIKSVQPNLLVEVSYYSQKWEDAFPDIHDQLIGQGFRNVIFNLDQYGHVNVNPQTINTIISTYPSPEIFLTFAIQSWLTFLQTTNKGQLAGQLQRAGVSHAELTQLSSSVSSKEMLGLAEKLVFESLKERAPYVSPFSIHNPDGWRYWMIHLAKSPRARQVYNDVLHDNSSYQAHYGRPGLNMLQYNPRDDAGFLYLFDRSARELAVDQLKEDIPRFVSGAGDVLIVGDFYEQIYNQTPAHADDIKAAMVESPDLEVINDRGLQRRKANKIIPTDVLRYKAQGHFFDILRKR